MLLYDYEDVENAVMFDVMFNGVSKEFFHNFVTKFQGNTS